MYKLLFSLAIASMVLTASGGAHASETIKAIASYNRCMAGN